MQSKGKNALFFTDYDPIYLDLSFRRKTLHHAKGYNTNITYNKMLQPKMLFTVNLAL